MLVGIALAGRKNGYRGARRYMSLSLVPGKRGGCGDGGDRRASQQHVLLVK